MKDMQPLRSKKVRKNIGGKNINIGFTNQGNKHLYSDTFKRTKGLEKEDLKNLDKALEKSTYIKSAPLSKERHDGITRFHYFKDADKTLYYNVAEKRKADNQGKKRPVYFLYSVTDVVK